MRTLGIRELRDRLSATIERVRRGETVAVTDRKRPVAMIVPFRAEGEEAALRHLAAAGRLAWAGGKPSGARRPPRVAGATVSSAVLEDRE
jgi:prevent-host-death family protein